MSHLQAANDAIDADVHFVGVSSLAAGVYEPFSRVYLFYAPRRQHSMF